jgi:hypothetical protein
MLVATKRKILLFVFAVAATLMLFASPIAPAFADCQTIPTNVCGG